MLSFEIFIVVFIKILVRVVDYYFKWMFLLKNACNFCHRFNLSFCLIAFVKMCVFSFCVL